mmetsp:Transcript_75107/g.220097  ORF Transcript_75107/g.220097 Transcript_75107/m.220097 type:complete len:274 (+) Transcript_75107:36-857(+)
MGPCFIDSSFCLLRWGEQGAFVVGYMSKGTEDLTGYGSSEGVGRSFGEHFGSVGLARRGIDLAALADGSGARPEDITAGILYLSETFVRLEQMLGSARGGPETRPQGLAEHLTFTLDLHRRKSGRVFVCEQVLIAQKHTSLGWPYTLAILRDVSDAVSVTTTLRAAARGDFPNLVRSREAAVHNWLLELSVDPDEAVAFLDDLVLDSLRHLPQSARLGVSPARGLAPPDLHVALAADAGPRLPEGHCETADVRAPPRGRRSRRRQRGRPKGPV